MGAPDTQPQTERFNRQVVHALDIKINGGVRTLAGARWEQANLGHDAGPSMAPQLVGGAMALALLALAVAAAVLWWRMVVRIQAIYAAGKVPGAAAPPA